MSDTNDIPLRQNSAEALHLMGARLETYRLADRLLIAQLGLSIALPLIGTFATWLIPSANVWAALAALIVLALDVSVLSPWQKRLIDQAARLAETFDCMVLELKPNEFVTGASVDRNIILRSASKWRKRKRADARIRDWYDKDVGKLPLHLGRIAAQRINLSYDSRLRHVYAIGLTTVVCAVALLVIVSGLVTGSTLADVVLTLTTVLPLLSWAVQEMYRQRGTAKSQTTLARSAQDFWDEAVAGKIDEAEITTKSREFQDAIYNRRASTPLILPGVYQLMRDELEAEMSDSASDMVSDYNSRLSSAYSGPASQCR